MRILLTADPELTVPPGPYGGVQRLVAQWIEELRKHGHQVALMARVGSTMSCDAFFPWPGNQSQNPAHTIRNARALASAARTFRADIVHSSSRLLYTWPLLLSGTPVIMTYHRRPGERQIAIARRLSRQLIFTGVSGYISELGGRGGGNWKTVYNCIDLNRLTFREKVAPDAPLVFLSRIDADKGAHLAIDIARRAGRQLIIAGNHSADENAVRYWRDLIEPHIDGQNIRYIGPVDDNQKNALLGSSCALIVPTQCDEAFGLVYAEALACGTPAIGTRRGAVPEIIDPGKNGWLISTVEEGVEAVSKIASLSRSVCRQSVEEKFSIPKIVAAYESIYRSLVVKPVSK